MRLYWQASTPVGEVLPERDIRFLDRNLLVSYWYGVRAHNIALLQLSIQA